MDTLENEAQNGRCLRISMVSEQTESNTRKIRKVMTYRLRKIKRHGKENIWVKIKKKNIIWGSKIRKSCREESILNKTKEVFIKKKKKTLGKTALFSRKHSLCCWIIFFETKMDKHKIKIREDNKKKKKNERH